jgi:hypothetical protein
MNMVSWDIDSGIRFLNMAVFPVEFVKLTSAIICDL